MNNGSSQVSIRSVPIVKNNNRPNIFYNTNTDMIGGAVRRRSSSKTRKSSQTRKSTKRRKSTKKSSPKALTSTTIATVAAEQPVITAEPMKCPDLKCPDVSCPDLKCPPQTECPPPPQCPPAPACPACPACPEIKNDVADKLAALSARMNLSSNITDVKGLVANQPLIANQSHEDIPVIMTHISGSSTNVRKSATHPGDELETQGVINEKRTVCRPAKSDIVTEAKEGKVKGIGIKSQGECANACKDDPNCTGSDLIMKGADGKGPCALHYYDDLYGEDHGRHREWCGPVGDNCACYVKPKIVNTQKEVCAAEGGECYLPYPSTVVYGALGDNNNKVDLNKNTSSKEVNSDIKCNNGVFGDPVYGVRKVCAYNVKPSHMIHINGTAYDHLVPDEKVKQLCLFGKPAGINGQREIMCGIGGDKKVIGASSDMVSVTRLANGGFQVCARNHKGHPHPGIHCRELDANGNAVKPWVNHIGK